ncbi:MAG: hypothetical protein A2252_00105 [Elusimicrobia bacterium RIFOXYA2_FULL_39_19]|nr:MAG: hypothetical protein A2252_00105 [Elusimicrobia bacterium RIFOXYA2_FULL_39_19]
MTGENLKAALTLAIQVTRELEDELGVSFSVGEICKMAVTLLISNNGKNGNGTVNGIGNGSGKHESAEESKLRIQFGKFKGSTLEEILLKDRGYLVWLASKSISKNIQMASAELLKAHPIKTAQVTVPVPTLQH